MCDFVDSKAAASKISQLLIDNSLSLIPSVLSRKKKHSKGLRYVKLPGDVKAARSVCKAAFDSWKKHDFSMVVTPTILTIVLVKNIVCFCVTSYTILNLTKLRNFVTQKNLTKNCFGSY